MVPAFVQAAHAVRWGTSRASPARLFMACWQSGYV